MGAVKNTVNKIVQSATDTEAIHRIVNDLQPPDSYFRFNPFLSEDLTLDEIRPEKWQLMTGDVQTYCKRNAAKFERMKRRLLESKTWKQRVHEYAQAQYQTSNIQSSTSSPSP